MKRNYWIVEGDLKFIPGENFIYASVVSCTMDGKPHLPRPAVLRINLEDLVSHMSSLLSREPIFETYESPAGEPTSICSTYKQGESVTYENQKAVIAYLMDMMIREHYFLRRHLIINPASNVYGHENMIILCHDLLKRLNVNIPPEALSSLSVDYYGVVIKSDEDGVVIRQYNGLDHRFAPGFINKPVHVNDRVRVHLVNSKNLRVSWAIKTTMDSSVLPAWVFEII